MEEAMAAAFSQRTGIVRHFDSQPSVRSHYPSPRRVTRLACLILLFTNTSDVDNITAL